MQKGSKYGEVPHGIVFTLRELVIVCVLISVVCKSNRCNLQTLGKDAFIVDALRGFSPRSPSCSGLCNLTCSKQCKVIIRFISLLNKAEDSFDITVFIMSNTCYSGFT